MNAEYRKELGKNYMILRPEGAENLFSVQMLLENQMDTLLHFERRVFNGEPEYYYDITAKHTLESSIKKELLREKDVRMLLQSLYYAQEQLYSYFLKPSGLLLNPVYIYQMEEGFCFAYFPTEKKESLEKIQEEFAEKLQEVIDYDDEGAVHLTYRFYQMVKQSEKGLLRILEDVLTEDFEREEADIEVFEQEEPGNQEEDLSVQKQKQPDLYTVALFMVSLLVSLCYLITASCFEKEINVTGVTACVFAVASVLGLVAAFVDIDIAEKK